MLIFTISYATIAIPLKSFSSIQNRRIGFISLLSIVVLGLTNFPSSYILSPITFSLYNDYLKATTMNHLIDLIILTLGAMLLLPYLYNSPSTSTVTSTATSTATSYYKEQKEYTEYILFCFCTLLGGILLSASNDLLLFILSIELQSYSLYIIASTSLRFYSTVVLNPSKESYLALPFNLTHASIMGHNGNDLSVHSKDSFLLFSEAREANEPSEAAGLKYYLLGALASSIILLGIGIIYATLGTSNFNSISILLTGMVQNTVINASPDMDGLIGFHLTSRIFETASLASQHPNLAIETLDNSNIMNTTCLGLLFIISGLIWKFAGAPLHSWAIDVYDAVPTVSASWLAIIPKIALLTSLSQIIFLSYGNTNNNYMPLGAEDMMIQLIFFVSVLSLTIGAIGALTQPFIKRVLAYSSIGQIGFILLGLAVGSSATEATLFYLIQYSLTNTGLWLALLSSSLYINKNRNKDTISSYPILPTSPASLGSVLNNNNDLILVVKQAEEVRTIKELQGLHNTNLFLALSFAVLLFSTAGIPPMIGFFAKLDIISASLNSGYTTLSFIAIISSLISATYYLIIIRSIWFYRSDASQSVLTSPFLTEKIEGVTTSHIKDNVANDTYGTISLSLSFFLAIITMVVLLYIFQGFVILDWFRVHL